MSHIITEIQHGRLIFNSRVVFEDINFTITVGQHWLITGPSGSGKTSLLHIIAGLRALNSGKIIYNFPDVKEDAVRTRIALVNLKHSFRDKSNTTAFYYQQRYNSADADQTSTVAAYLNETVSQQAAHVTANWNLSTVTEKLRLKPLLNRHIIQLSNGETRRLLIAAALLENPHLLLLDNPFAGLDVDTRRHFNQLFASIAASGITLIMTGTVHEVPEVITHIGMFNNGQLDINNKKHSHVIHMPVQQDLKLQEIKHLLNEGQPRQAYQSLVNIKSATVSYAGTEILHQINWQIKPGERWALTGPNGSGKSTLLSLINGDNPQAYANNIILFDRKRGTGESIWGIKKHIGFISPEMYQYFPADQSCLQVTESGFYDTMGLYRPVHPRRNAFALMWLKVFNLESYAHQLFKFLPAGAQRLCLLARALVKCPPLLILDEPCQGLDDEQQAYFNSVINSICAVSNTALIYVTHYPNEIPATVQYHLRLDERKVVYSGPYKAE